MAVNLDLIQDWIDLLVERQLIKKAVLDSQSDKVEVQNTNNSTLFVPFEEFAIYASGVVAGAKAQKILPSNGGTDGGTGGILPTPEEIGAIALSQKGEPLGIATLDENGHILSYQLPLSIFNNSALLGIITPPLHNNWGQGSYPPFYFYQLGRVYLGGIIIGGDPDSIILYINGDVKPRTTFRYSISNAETAYLEIGRTENNDGIIIGYLKIVGEFPEMISLEHVSYTL